MPPRGFLKLSIPRNLFFFLLTCLFVFPIISAFNPKQALADYRWAGDQCRFYYGDMDGHELSLPVDDSYCEGGDPGGSCNPRDYSDCEDMGVPGKGGINGCYPNGEIKVRYDFDGNPATVETNPTGAPTGILFDAKCSSTWSDGGNHDYHLNIDYLNEDEGWRSIRHEGLGSQEDFKIENGDSSKYVPMSLLRDDMAVYTKAKAFVFYPNCAGREDSVDGGCFRTSNLEAYIVDPYAPTCSVTSTKVGNDYRIDITGNDQGSGIIRMGLSYTPVDGNKNPTGSEIIQVNNDFLLSEGRTSVTQSFTIPGSAVSGGQYYNVTAKVWDVKGSNNYISGTDYSANYGTCTTMLQCIMPQVQTSFNMSCTPAPDGNGGQYSPSVVTAYNLNQNDRCKIDYVNVSDIGTTSPDVGTFDYPNYWNKNVSASTSQTTNLPEGVLRRVTNAPLIFAPNKRYWVTYYDSETQQTAVAPSFVTPNLCRKPGVPTITYTPECKIDPGNISDPANPKRELRWVPLSGSQRGDGFLRYKVEVWRVNNTNLPQYRVYTTDVDPTLSKIALGAWWVTQLQPGNTYYYRIRGESWGGLGNWTALSSGLLIKKPTSAQNFIRSGYSSGQGATGTPYLDLDWTYSDSTAPVATSQGWRLEKLNAPGTITTLLPGSQTSFRQNLTAAQCNDTDHQYRLSGQNTCGQGPYVYGTFRCLANKSPTCDPIQYSTNNGSTWANYPTGSTGLIRNPSTGILLRRQCTDPEGNSIRYDWSTSAGCGTFNPATQTKTSPHTNGGLTSFTFSSNYNTSCNLTSSVRDTLGHIAPNATVVAKTFPYPDAGSHSIVLGPRSIERLNTADAYRFINGQAQDLATVQYRILGYDNLSDQGATTNLPGVATINTTTADLGNGKLNVCHPNYGTCTFALTGTQTVSNIRDENSYLDINVRLNTSYQPRIRDVMINPSTTNQKYSVRVNFSASTRMGGTVTAVANGSPRIVNNPPTCSSLVFGPAPGSPYRTGNITVAVAGRDDWGLERLRINYRPLSGGTATTVVDENYFNKRQDYPDRYGTASFNIDTTNMLTRYYRVDVTMWDLDGNSVNCTANNATGDETPGGTPISGDPPIILIDKQPPQCGTTGLTVSPNASGTLLGFTVSGTDPTVRSSFSGLSRVHILAKRPNDANFSATPVLSFNIPTTPKPQNYTHTFSNASAATSYNIANLPSGTYTFRAVWTDRAGNVSTTPTSTPGPCDTTYEKASRISGKVNLFTGTNGEVKRDYAVEASGAQFTVGTKSSISQPAISAVWQNASGTACRATYPGTAGTSTCAAYYVSGAEYTTSTPPIVELRFPRLTTDSTIGKYRCNMSVFNTTISPWILKRTIPSTNAAGTGATCSGTTCVCRFALTASDMTVNPTVAYSPTSIWPTHVEFDVSYNSDQVYGRVENETGNLVPNSLYSVNVSESGWTSPLASVVGGNYVVPAPSPDNTVSYARTNRSATVKLNNTDPTRLCVWASRNNFTTNAERTTATATAASANPRTVAQQLALPGFTVGANSQCQTEGISLNSSVISPKLQNQVNFYVIPKVQITGQIYYLKNDNICGNPAEWTNPDNWSTDAPINVDLGFATNDGTVGTPLDSFYNPSNPASPTGSASYTTGQSYTVYANELPGSNWAGWQIQTNIGLPVEDGVSRFTSCGSGTIDVSTSIPNYPTGLNSAVINRNIAVYMNETNDWWQAYNGGVHALNSIQDRIPVATANGEDLCSHDIHTIVGRATCNLYSTGISVLRNPPFRGFATGGLVTTRGSLLETSGRPSFNWTINGSTAWGDSGMKTLRLPYANSDTGNLTAVENVDALGATQGWVVNPGNFNAIGTAGNGRIYIEGDRAIDAPLTFGINNYLVIDGDLNINANLLANGSGNDMRQSVFIIASGDVTIGGSVTELNAFIYTPGTITIRGGNDGPDELAEVPLKIYGGLYAGTRVDFRRDIANTDANWGYPTTQIMFNPSLVTRSRRPEFPSLLKESNVYWTQE